VVKILQRHNESSDTATNNNVVIIGNGNVALDCARILAKGGSCSHNNDNGTPSTTEIASVGSSLLDTDIATRALNVINDYPITDISIVGRRGHVQASFTIKELRELINLPSEGYTDTSLAVQKEELDLGTATMASQEELNGPNGRPKLRIDKLLRETALKGNLKMTNVDSVERENFLISIFWAISKNVSSSREHIQQKGQFALSFESCSFRNKTERSNVVGWSYIRKEHVNG
jgi:hypothetical protein